MNEVKWIKITTRMFEDEKIDFIESLPEADAILIIWIKLLTQAGKNNVDGFIFLTESIPYTDEMLAHKFRRPLNTVKLAMATLKELEMIEYDDKGFLRISNWEKHQNIEGLTKIREQGRLRVAKHREKQKLLENSNEDVTLYVTLRNGTEEEEDIDIDIDIDTTTVAEGALNPKEIVSLWNKSSEKPIQSLNKNTVRRTMLNARVKEYGIEKVREAISSVEKSSYLNGGGSSGWIATFDWFVKPNNFLKVLEGNYEDREKNKDKELDDYFKEVEDDKSGSWKIDNIPF